MPNFTPGLSAEGMRSESSEKAVPFGASVRLQTRLTAELKSQHKLPYADCFAASLALLQRATLVTADSDFLLLRKKLPIVLLS